MIQLHNDYLLFKTLSGETIPCSVEKVTIELVGDAASNLNPELVRQAAAAVLHYFKHDLGQNTVSIADFSVALERVLTDLGVSVTAQEPSSPQKIETSDLRDLAHDTDKGFELAFFSRLRCELKSKLGNSPQMLAFKGLRGCVKKLLGAKRWTNQCQELSDQIVDYLRQSFSTEARTKSCHLLIH